MPKFNVYSKQELAELLQESGIPLIDFQADESGGLLSIDLWLKACNTQKD